MGRLRYSTGGIVRQCLLVVFTALVMGGLLFLPSHNNPAPYQRIGPVWTSVVLMLIAYGAVVQAVRTWLLLGDDRAALCLTSQGIDYHGAWVRRSFAWIDIRNVALERRSTRGGHYYVIAIHCSAGWRKRYDVRARLLEGTLDAIGDWADKAEAQLLSHGGALVTVPTGWLSGRIWRWDQARIAKARHRSTE